MGMRRENGKVSIEITDAEFTMLLLALGFAAGSTKDDWDLKIRILSLLNSVTEGNPDFRPYAVPEPVGETER
jgi:hypothetical protein